MGEGDEIKGHRNLSGKKGPRDPELVAERSHLEKTREKGEAFQAKIQI